jgi:hypothetical protein
MIAVYAPDPVYDLTNKSAVAIAGYSASVKVVAVKPNDVGYVLVTIAQVHPIVKRIRAPVILECD